MDAVTQSSTPHFHGSLTDRIRFRMARSLHGDISFYEYMNDCLYDPDHGYYVRDVPKIGKEGDFYTSAHIGNVMGKMLARFIADKTVTFDHFTVVEWGAEAGDSLFTFWTKCAIITRKHTEGCAGFQWKKAATINRSS